jgi:asparagine N-glycosylation enzyme membrane subunit Stt3
MRFGIYQPFHLQIRIALWLLWAVITLGVIAAGSRSPQPNHPVGLLLLGLGLAGPAVLAMLTLLSQGFRERLIDPDSDVQTVRPHLHALVVLGLVGIVMIWSALERLL